MPDYDYAFTLPWPPSINNYRSCIGNRLVTSRKARVYFKQVAIIIRRLKLHKLCIAQPVLISLMLNPPSRRRYDCSNFLKAYEDALVKGGLLEDDHWIEYSGIRKGEVIKDGVLTVHIELLE